MEWTRVFNSNQPVLAELIKNQLENENIPVALVNKIDSAYSILGEVELWVPIDYVIRAIYIINLWKDEK
jgi:hypothetical protein